VKIIFSRKGLDSSIGHVPSPIFPDGTIFSLPIPAGKWKSKVTYGDLGQINGHSVAQVIEDLTHNKITRKEAVHLDPDLRPTMLRRRRGWRPLFGPSDKSHSHMAHEKKGNVQSGDIILFFGWFKEVTKVDGTYQFVRAAPDLHVLFGWLQIERWLPAGPRGCRAAPVWAQYHPHFLNDWGPGDHVYISTGHLVLPGLRKKLPGAGIFPSYSELLRLTAPGCTRSQWRLPRCFHPKNNISMLTYHDVTCWKNGILHTRARGQEFVFNAEQTSKTFDWIRNLFACAAPPL
jgi:hypothetical protein